MRRPGCIRIRCFVILLFLWTCSSAVSNKPSTGEIEGEFLHEFVKLLQEDDAALRERVDRHQRTAHTGANQMVDFLTLLTEKVQNDLITEGNLDLRGRADHDHAAETPAENKLSNKASIMAGNSREDASGVDSESVVQQEEGLKEGPERDQTSALASKIKPADVLASSIHLVSSNALQQTSKGVLGKEKKAMNHKSLEHDLLQRHSSDSDAALANRDTSDAALPNRDTSAKLDDKPREGEASNTEDASLDQTDLMMDTVGDESKDVFEGLSMKADEAEDASSKGSRIVKETPSLGMEEFKLVGISKDSSADQSSARFPWSELDLCFQADGSGESWRRLVNDCYQWTGQIGKYLTAERAQRESERRWRECLTKIMRRNDEEAEDEEDCLKRHRFLILRKVSPLTRDEMLDQGITCFAAASFATALFFLVSAICCFFCQCLDVVGGSPSYDRRGSGMDVTSAPYLFQYPPIEAMQINSESILK